MNNVTEEKPQANRIFISYKRADLALVSKIKERIESELHETCWFDLDGIESRQQFRSKICKAIDRATIFLFMYSKSHLNIDFENDWTIKELDYAQTKKKIVVLVNIDNNPLDNLFLLDFGSKNNIDASDATQMKKLIKDLKGWLGIKEEQIAEDVSNDIRIIRYSEENLANQRSELSKRIESIDSQSLRKKLMSELEQSNPSAFEERSKSRSLLKQIDALNSEIDSLKEEIKKTIKEKLASGEYVTREAVEQIKRTANAEAEENIRIALDAQAKKYQTTIEELKKKCSTLESELTDLRKSVEIINQDKDTLSESKEELRKECDSLAEKLASVNASYQSLTQVNASLLKDNSELKNQQKKLEREVSQLESANSTLRNENSKLSFKISELSQTIAENNTQLTSLSSKNKRYKLYVWLLLALLILSTIITLILIPSSDSEHKSDSDPTEEVVVEPETADRSFTVSEHKSDSDPTEEVVVEPETADRSFTVKGVTFNMVKVAGGTFTMGATAEQGKDAYVWERPVHQVTLSDYYIGQTEVTQALWTAVMGDNPSEFKGDNLPVDSVSWDDCQTFLEKLNSLFSNELGGKRFALPMEAQWEFAARGGKQSKGYRYAGSNNISNVAWYYSNSGYQTHPVAQKQPNELGLYDMIGNVWEWCQDWFGRYSSDAQTNPQGPASGENRVYRGGSWCSDAEYCRVSYRGNYAPDDRNNSLGFRLCLIP